MSGDDPRAPFDVAVEPLPQGNVVDAEEDEESKRAREAALASTFDPNRAHAGKTEDELIAEREADARVIVDVAIVTAVAIALHEADADDPESEDLAPTDSNDGE